MNAAGCTGNRIPDATNWSSCFKSEYWFGFVCPEKKRESTMVAPEETKQKDNAEDLAKLYKAIEVVEEKLSCLVENYFAESDSAQQHIGENNKSAARQCLRRKGYYEQLIEKTGEYLSRLQDVMIRLDDSLTKRPGYQAFASCRGYRRTMNTNSAEHEINEIIADMEDMKQIEMAISDSIDTTAIGALTNHDEEKIEFELKMIEGELRRLAATATACPRSAVP